VAKNRGDLGRATNGVISSKLSYKKLFKDVALGEVNIVTKVSFYYYIYDFGLAVRFRLVYYKEANYNL
jgi:hypothetical protein